MAQVGACGRTLQGGPNDVTKGMQDAAEVNMELLQAIVRY